MRNWDDDNQYQSDYEDISEQNSAPVEAEYSQPYLVHPQADQPQSNDDFVRQAYRDVLGREADEGGAGWWSSVLDSGGSREDVISAFQNSDEYKALQAASVASTPEPEPQAQQLELWTMQSLEQAQQQVYTPPPAPVQQTAEEPYNDYRGQMDGGNGGWAGAAGGGFFDGMNSSGGDSWYGAGSDYMNNSNDYSAGGNFSIAQYQDASELAGPTFAPPPVAAPVPVEPEIEESEYSGYEYNDSDPTVTADDFSTESYSDDPVEMDPGSDYVIAIPDAPPGPSSHPPINQWGNPVVDMNAYQAQMDQVDNSSVLQLANTYTELIDQQGALSNYSFETYQQYQSVVKNNGADSAEAQSLKAMMDRVNTATSAVTAQLEAAETAAMAAFYQNDAQANSLYQQYQGVVQSHGANSAEAQAMYTTYTVARDNTNSGALGNVLQTYHMRHLYDNGGPPDERQQGQSTGSGIMEDLMIGMGLASLSSSTFIQASTEYQAPRAVGHFADPSYGQNAARDAQIDQMNNQAYVNQLISQYTGEQAQNVTPQPYVQPQAPVGQEAVGGFDGGPYQPDNGNESLADAMANSDYVPWESDYPTSDPTISENDFSTGGNETSPWTPVGSPGSHQFGMNPTQNNEISNAINQALNPHLVNVMGTDEMGGITNRDGSYTIEGVDYVNREAAFPSAVDNTVRTDLQTITTTAYRGLGDSDGAVKIILDKQFADPAIQQVNVNGTVYNRPPDGSTNWIPAALQPGVDRLVDAVSQMPGGNFAINSVKAIPGIANALDNGIGNVLGYMENNNGVDAINDVLNAITPSGNSNMAPLGDAMGSGAYEISNVAPDANPRPSNYVSDIKNAGGFIFDTTGKLIDGAIIHPLAAGGSALYNLSTEVLTPEQAAKEFGRVAIGALTAAPFVGGAVKAVGAGAEFVGGVKAAVGVSEALTLDAAAAARAGSNLGRVDNLGPNSPLQIPGSTLDGIVMPDGSFMPGSFIHEIPGGGVPRIPDMTAPYDVTPGMPSQPPLLNYVDDAPMDVAPGAGSQPVMDLAQGEGLRNTLVNNSDLQNILTSDTTDLIRSLEPDTMLRLRIDGQNAQMTAKEFADYAIANPQHVYDTRVSGVVRPEGTPAPTNFASSADPLVIDTVAMDPSAIQRVQVTFQSGEVAHFTGDGAMLAQLSHNSTIVKIEVNTASPGWYPHVNEVSAVDRVTPNFTQKFDEALNPQLVSTTAQSDLNGMTVYHGTHSALVDSVVAGPRDIGTGFGGKGLYVSMEGERSLAAEYAGHAVQDARARASYAGVELDAASNVRPVVLEGNLNPNRDFTVGSFTVDRSTLVPDLANGRLPANWADDPRLAAYMQDKFDILEIKGTSSGGLNLSTDRFIVVHERAGVDAIIWKEVPSPTPIRAAPDAPTVPVDRDMNLGLETQPGGPMPISMTPDGVPATPVTTLPDDLDWEAWIRGDAKAPVASSPTVYGDPRVISSSPPIAEIFGESCGARAVRMNNELAGLEVRPLVGDYTRMDFERSFGAGSVTEHAAQDTLIEQIAKAKEGDSFIIGIQPKDPTGTGHAINAQVVDGRVVFRDPGLDGKYVSNDLGMFTSGMPENYTFFTVNGSSANPIVRSAIDQPMNFGTPIAVQTLDEQLAAIDNLLADFRPPQTTAPVVPRDMIPEDWNATPGAVDAPVVPQNVIPDDWNMAPAVDAPAMPQNAIPENWNAAPVMDMTPPAAMDVPQLFEAQNVMTNSTAIRQAIPDNVQSTVSMQSFDGTGRASGDFVGVYNGAAPSEVHILVGDIMGHGDKAARSSVELQQVMALPENQALLSREGLVGLDRVLSENPANTVNSAMSHLVLNTDTGALQATSIGDTSVLISHADGTITEVPHTGPVIGGGVLEMVPTPQPTVVALRPNDQVFVVTDGIIDRFQSNGVFDLQGIRTAIAQARAQGLTVEQTVARLQEHPRPVGVDADDSTAFAFQWRPPGT